MNQMEAWDIYDCKRQFTGILKYRGQALTPQEYHISVGIWTMNSKREILLTKRHPNKRYAPNMWENTGGSVLAGETSRQGAVRELFEETGIKVKEKDLLFLGSERTVGHFMDAYLVVKDVPIEQIILQEGETVDAMWVTVEAFEKLIKEGLFAKEVAKRFYTLRPYMETVYAKAVNRRN